MRVTSRSITLFSSLITLIGGTSAFPKPKPGVHPDTHSNCYGYEYVVCGMGSNCGNTDLYAECQALLGCSPSVAARCNYVDNGIGGALPLTRPITRR